MQVVEFHQPLSELNPKTIEEFLLELFRETILGGNRGKKLSEVECFARGCHLDPPRLETLFPSFHLGELGTNQRTKLVFIFEELTIVEELLIADEHVGEFLQSFKSRICCHDLSLLLCRLSCKVETKWLLV